jgi:hypothetical protein
MIEWKERQNELNDVATLKSPQSRVSLINYSLLGRRRHKLGHNFSTLSSNMCIS